MALIRWKPFPEIDKFFEDLKSTAVNKDLAADVYEKDGNVLVEVNVAGIDPKNIDLTVENDFIRIVASREEETKEEGKGYFIKEIHRGHFERLIDLPVSVNAEQSKAEFKDGMLLITLPKMNKKEGHKIKIEKG